jgi:hypothetical protein
MGHVIGLGRRGRETYPEAPRAATGGVDAPFVNLSYVDYNTTVPVLSQNGSDENPYGTVQAAIDAGRFFIELTGGNISEDVVVPAGAALYLTGANKSAFLNSLTVGDGRFVEIENVLILSTLIAGDNVYVRTNCQIGGGAFGNGGTLLTSANVGDITFGTGGFFVPSGPGAVPFIAKVDQLQLDNVTMGASGNLVASNAVFSTPATVTVPTIELFGCTFPSDMNADTLNAKNCALTQGTYTTTSLVSLQDCKVDAGVVFANDALAQFQLDGYTNYWIKTNAVALANPGQKVITEDLVA